MRTRCSGTRVRLSSARFRVGSSLLTCRLSRCHAGETVYEQRAADRKRKVTTLLAGAAAEEGADRVRVRCGCVSPRGAHASVQGIWAAAAPRGEKPMQSHDELTAEQKAYIEWHNARREARRVRGSRLRLARQRRLSHAPYSQRKPADEDVEKKEEAEEEAEPDTGHEKSHFHGKSETDYAGNSWLTAPKDKKKENDTCYVPKRWIHTWSGHTKGTSAIRFFPGSGHLLLSAGMDNKVKIWDVYNSGKCMRTYMGHTQAVKDICFSNDGRRFVTCSYDKDIKWWDTETGKVVGAVTPGKVPHCVKLHPHPDKQNVLLAGLADRKIMQWDLNTGDMTQEYEQHLVRPRRCLPRRSAHADALLPCFRLPSTPSRSWTRAAALCPAVTTRRCACGSLASRSSSSTLRTRPCTPCPPLLCTPTARGWPRSRWTTRLSSTAPRSASG